MLLDNFHCNSRLHFVIISVHFLSRPSDGFSSEFVFCLSVHSSTFSRFNDAVLALLRCFGMDSQQIRTQLNLSLRPTDVTADCSDDVTAEMTSKRIRNETELVFRSTKIATDAEMDSNPRPSFLFAIDEPEKRCRFHGDPSSSARPQQQQHPTQLPSHLRRPAPPTDDVSKLEAGLKPRRGASTDVGCQSFDAHSTPLPLPLPLPPVHLQLISLDSSLASEPLRWWQYPPTPTALSQTPGKIWNFCLSNRLPRKPDESSNGNGESRPLRHATGKSVPSLLGKLK